MNQGTLFGTLGKNGENWFEKMVGITEDFNSYVERNTRGHLTCRRCGADGLRILEGETHDL